MPKGLIEKQIVLDIANAIREKSGSSDKMKPSEFADKIKKLSNSGSNSVKVYEKVAEKTGNFIKAAIPVGVPLDKIYIDKNYPEEKVNEAIDKLGDSTIIFYNEEHKFIIQAWTFEEDNEKIYAILLSSSKGENEDLNVLYFSGNLQKIGGSGPNFVGFNPDIESEYDLGGMSSLKYSDTQSYIGDKNEYLKDFLWTYIEEEKEVNRDIYTITNDLEKVNYNIENGETIDVEVMIKNGKIPGKITSGSGLLKRYVERHTSVWGYEELFRSALVSTSYLDYGNARFYGITSIMSNNDFDISWFKSQGESASYMFCGCESLESIPAFDTQNIKDMKYMFAYCRKITNIPLLDTHNALNMQYMFIGCKKLTTIPLLNTSNVTDMRCMFSYCSNLTSIPLLNTSNVTNMNYMFNECEKLITIPLLDTSNVTSIAMMFYECEKLEIIPELDASNISNMNGAFGGCYSLKEIHMKNIKASFDISDSTLFTEEALVEILNNLQTVTTETTLTMGDTNLAKLTDEEKSIAINKGWTLK